MSKILIVDDDFPVLTMVEQAFVISGHQVLVTTEPREVTGLLDANPIDAVIMDVVMPDLTGWDLLRDIRARPRWRSLPVLMLSGLGDTEDRVRGLKAGADDYVMKPFDPLELVARVERLVARRTGGVGLEGNLEDFAPGDVTQNLTQGTKTGCLRITGDSQLVEVHFLRGRIVRAVAGGLRGADAILSLLGMNSGHFVFETSSEEMVAPIDSGSDLQVNSIFLQAAWLEDELLRRQAILPTWDQPLGVKRASLTEIPEEFAELPLASIYGEIQRSPGIALRRLLNLELAAPSRIMLALVLMIEKGVVGVDFALSSAESLPETGAATAETGTATVTEVADSAVSKDLVGGLLASCRARGHTSDTLHLLVLFQPAVWEALVRLVEATPQALLSERRSKLVEELRQRGSGTVRLADEEISILLNLKPLRAGGKPQGGALLALAAGVILWLADDSAAEALTIYRDAVSERSVGVMLCPGGSKQPVSDSDRWRVSSQTPANIESLLALLSQGG